MNNVADWVKEDCSTVGTGPLILSRFDNAHARFQDAIPPGSSVWYSIADGLDREAGLGTFDGVNKITRTVVHNTLVGGVWDDTNPVPISLTGNAIVSCTLNMQAWEDSNAHAALTDNPHQVTATQVGLSNVDNTSDANKPISTATQAALDLKASQTDLDATDAALAVLDTDVSYRESAVTGLEFGGDMTQSGNVSVLIAAGKGEIVDSYTDVQSADATDITWVEQTYDILADGGMPLATGIGITDIYMIENPSVAGQGIPTAYPNGASNQERREGVRLGMVEYADQVITDVIDMPIVSNQAGNTLLDYIGYLTLEDRIKGLVLRPTTIGDLSVWRDAGALFEVGINYTNNVADQNVIVVDAVGAVDTAIPFYLTRYNNGTTAIGATVSLVPGDSYELGGAGTVTALPNNNATIHYMFESLAGNRYMLYGQTVYADYATAVANLFTDRSLVLIPTELEGMILLSQIVVLKGATAWSSTTAEIYPIASATSSSSGGGSVADAVNINYSDTYGIGSNVQSAIDTLASLKLTPDQNDSIDGASSPSAANPMATVADVTANKDASQEAADETAMLALVGVEQGDVVVRTDESKTYKNIAGNNALMSDWLYLKSAAPAGLANDSAQAVADEAALLALGSVKQGDIVVQSDEGITYKNKAGVNTVIGDWLLIEASVVGLNIDGGTSVTVDNLIQVRRDTAANWTANNPTLSAGEWGFETDTDKKKIGDGATIWASLPYDIGSLVEDTTPQLGGALDTNGKTIDESSYRQPADAAPTTTQALDFSAGDMLQVTVSQNVTISFSNFVTGQVCTYILELVNAGGYTVTWPAGLLFDAGVAPTLTTTGKDALMLIKDKDEVFSLYVIGQAVA